MKVAIIGYGKMGREIEKITAPGLYIINGQKVLVK